ncbi:MAG: SLC13 family permease [Myxococcota bacterium]
MIEEPGARRVDLRRLGRYAGPLLALGVYGAFPESYVSAQGDLVPLTDACRATAAVGVWMAVWWMTEAIPLYATALLPLAMFPLTGAADLEAAATPYAHELIYLFMGGFVLALSMQRWGLDRRISLHTLRWAGTRPTRIVAAFMGVTATLSMWVSNTATAVMMLPIALGVIGLVERRSEGSAFAPCLLLGLAYAASIGGVGTIIGTPPNLFLVSYVKSHLGIEIGFARWMLVGLPVVALFLPLAWLVLTRVLHPPRVASVEGGAEHIRELLAGLGAMKRGEWITLCVFSVTAFAWLTRPWLTAWRWGDLQPLAGLSDPGIAILAALSLFLIPAEREPRVFTMDWETANRLPWGLLILFGGGLSLSAAIRANGLGEFLGHSIHFLHGVPAVWIVGGAVALMIFLTEITSNTATAATLIPIFASLAPGLGVEPLALIVPVTIAASCAFMLPVATPPNAVVFGSGHLGIGQMCRAGVWLNLLGILLITGLCQWLVVRLLLLTPA